MSSNYCRHELSNLSWIRKLRKGEQKVDKILDSFVQQDMKVWGPGKNLFHPKVAFFLFFIGGIFHAVFAAFFYSNYKSTTYSEYITEPILKDMNSLILNVTSDMKAPINVNIYIDNFYQNFRSFVQSRPPEIFPGFSCGTAVTLGYLRQVRGNTLDNYIKKIPGVNLTNDDSKNIPLIPCGLSSITFFNDEFELLLLKENNKKEPVQITTDNLSLKNDFSMFAIPYNEQMWIKTTDIHYRTWMHGAWLPNFKMVWGQIPHDIKKGLYEIKMNYNMWPAEDFNSKKRIGLEKVSFLGSKNLMASYFFLIWSIWLFIVSILLITLIFMSSNDWNKYKSIKKRFLKLFNK